MTQVLERNLKNELAFAKVAAVMTAPIAIAGLCILLYQGFEWFRLGSWHYMPMRDYAPESVRMASFGWPAFETVFFKALSLELGVCVFAIGGILLYLSLRSLNDSQSQLDAIKRMNKMRR